MRRGSHLCVVLGASCRSFIAARTRAAEDYPDRLARVIAALMAAPDNYDGLDDVFPVYDDWGMATAPSEDQAATTATTEEPAAIDDEVWAGKEDVATRLGAARVIHDKAGLSIVPGADHTPHPT